METLAGIGVISIALIAVFGILYLLDRMGLFYQLRRRELRREIQELERKRDELQNKQNPMHELRKEGWT